MLNSENMSGFRSRFWGGVSLGMSLQGQRGDTGAMVQALVAWSSWFVGFPPRCPHLRPPPSTTAGLVYPGTLGLLIVVAKGLSVFIKSRVLPVALMKTGEVAPPDSWEEPMRQGFLGRAVVGVVCVSVFVCSCVSSFALVPLWARPFQGPSSSHSCADPRFRRHFGG